MTAAERAIVEEVETAVGRRPVLLAGSRALGDSAPGSDWDVAVVLPAWRVPFDARRLAGTAGRLERRLACSVSINPLSAGFLRRRRRLFAWKLQREARVLAAPGGFELRAPAAPHLTAFGEFSYLLSAIFYLLDGLDPRALAEGTLPTECGRGTVKAMRHLRQLELLRRGRYDPLPEVGDPTVEGWFEARRLVLEELARLPPQPGLARGLIRNAQYAGVSALRGSWRLRAALGLQPVERRLARAAVELLAAPRTDGTVDEANVDAAARALPRSLRPRDHEWRLLRLLVAREWANAHPLLGL